MLKLRAPVPDAGLPVGRLVIAVPRVASNMKNFLNLSEEILLKFLSERQANTLHDKPSKTGKTQYSMTFVKGLATKIRAYDLSMVTTLV